MYKDYTQRIKFEIDVESYEEICSGCPTVFDFKDKDGTKYYFRLRHGYARIECEDTNEVLISNDMDGYDGVCGWDVIVNWSKKNGLLLNY